MFFKNWIKDVQTADCNGARTVVFKFVQQPFKIIILKSKEVLFLTVSLAYLNNKNTKKLYYKQFKNLAIRLFYAPWPQPL